MSVYEERQRLSEAERAQTVEKLNGLHKEIAALKEEVSGLWTQLILH